MAELFQLLERHRLRDVPGLRVPWHEVAELFAGALGDTRMAGEVNDETILSAHLARQEIDQGLLQSAGAGVLVVQLDNLFKPQRAKSLSDGLGVIDHARKLWREQIVFNTDDHSPRFIIQTLGLAHLRLDRREDAAFESKTQENREER